MKTTKRLQARKDVRRWRETGREGGSGQRGRGIGEKRTSDNQATDNASSTLHHHAPMPPGVAHATAPSCSRSINGCVNVCNSASIRGRAHRASTRVNPSATSFALSMRNVLVAATAKSSSSSLRATWSVHAMQMSRSARPAACDRIVYQYIYSRESERDEYDNISQYRHANTYTRT